MDLRLKASWDSNHVLQIQNSFQDDIQLLCVHESIILKLIFFFKEEDERSYFQLRITALFTRCVHSATTLSTPMRLSSEKDWLALACIISLSFSLFPGPNDPNLSVLRTSSRLSQTASHTYPSVMNECLTAPEVLALRGLPVQTVCLWVCHLGTWNILLTLLRFWPSNTPAAESSPYTSPLK